MDQVAQRSETKPSAAAPAAAPPAVDPKLIRRAARILIGNHGPAAAERATERYRLLLAEGYKQAAELWLDVTKAIASLSRPRKVHRR
ncbi:MAG TPA: hypothetical protein VHM01_11035 [Alphaproteobacteria bacterium]|nr:hypothetical protein [Alphaproteobacteria bacterium]